MTAAPPAPCCYAGIPGSTARWSKGLRRTIDEQAWTQVGYDTPVHDEHTGQAIHTGQIAA